MISLIPVTTAWMAESRLAAVPVFVYALNFVLVEMAYIAFERIAFSQSTEHDMGPELRRIAKVRSYVALFIFITATAVSLWIPRGGFVLVCCVLLIYFSPRLPALLQARKRRKPL